MTDPFTTLTLSLSGLAGVGILAAAGLSGWRGWLQLQHSQMVRPSDDDTSIAMPHAGARIEMADLKERIRKLEAIAAGVEL